MSQEPSEDILCPLCGLRVADYATRFGLVCGPCSATLPTICDFCSSTIPEWAYPAHDFQSPMMPQHRSAGAWAACNHCHNLIEAERWGDLARWCLEHFPDFSDLDANYRRAILLSIERIHTLFRQHRTGPARRLSLDTDRC